MSDNPEDHELLHHGVKGMKWGVRKKSDGTSSGRSTRAEKKQARRQHDADIKKARAQNVDHINDAFQKRANYDKQTTDKGRKVAEKLLNESIEKYEKNFELSMEKTRGEKIARNLIYVAGGVAATTAVLGSR